MARFTRRVDKQNKTVTVTDNMTGESVTGRYHDSLGAKETGDAIEGDLVQKEARPRVSDETSTAMQTRQLQDQSGANKMSQEGFLAQQRLLKARTQPEGESALTRASQGVSAVNNNDPGIMNIPGMPKQDAQMSTNMAMQKSRDQINRLKQGNSLGKMATVAGSYSGNENDPAMPTVPEQGIVDSSIKNAMRRNLEQGTRGMRERGQENIDQANRDRRAILENMYKTGDDLTKKTIEENFGGKKIDYQKTFGGEGVSSSSSDPVEQFLRGSKRSDITLQERMARQDAENEKLIAEDPSRGSVSIPYAGYGQGKAPSEEQASSRNPALSMFNTPEEYERLAKEEASFLKELQGESISPNEVATLQEERRKSWDADPSTLEEKTIKFDAEKPVPKKVAQLPREEKTAVKEANGTHVRDESTGFTLNLSRLKKSFKRQEHFAMLKHIPQENRAAMLAQWGYIDDDELTVAQKKSALQLQKLENAKLQGAKYQIELEQAQKNVGQSLTPVQEKQFSMLKDQYKEAAGRKPPNWVMMEEIGNELGKIHPSFKDKRNYKQMKKQYMESEKKELMKDGAVVKALSGIGVKGKDYYDTKERLYLSAEEKVKGASVEDLFKMDLPQKGGATTNLGNLLESQGFASWESVDELQKNNPKSEQLVGLRKVLGLKEGSAITSQSYKGWAMDQFVNRSMTDIYGDTHLLVQQLTTEHIRGLQKQVNNPKATEEETTTETPEPKPDPNPDPKIVDTVEKNLPLIDQAFANELTRGNKEYQSKFLSFLRSPDNVIDAMKSGKKDLGSYMRRRRRAFNMDASDINSLVDDPQAIVDFFRKNVEEYAKLPDEAKFYIAQEDQNLKAGRK